jgi:hypothetical protein
MVRKKEAENIPKLKDLLIQAQRMWNVKLSVVSTVTGSIESHPLEALRRRIAEDGRSGSSTRLGEEAYTAFNFISTATLLKPLHDEP